ncbi:bifunctional diguanylate cyclase/phosphodiesterase [Neptuniibacter halophilus]|uniref:bifunctional diguanylate cyclase/phosphodiesterase n=1 Tax=Neptuniibacter halophilus TaxID=651666 RepID=UPI002573B971|nr:EAL domain-containing protein [Neptuniibacter halophilus]
MSLIHLRHRLAFRQAVAVVLISVVIGFCTKAVEIYLDLRHQQDSAAASIAQVVELHRDTAARAVYLLDRNMGREVTDALISHPAIYSAVVMDDFGDPLAASKRSPSQEIRSVFSGELVGYLLNFESHIEQPLRLEGVGYVEDHSSRLVIDIDTPFIASEVGKRAIDGLAIGLFNVLLLALTLLFLFYHYLSRPILRIARWVEQLGEGELGKLPYTQRDELGDLVNSIGHLWQERQEATDRLSESVAQLSRSEQFSRSLMENAGDAMFLCELDGTIVRLNHQAADSLGYAQGALLGSNLAKFSEIRSQSEYQSLFDSMDSREAVTFEDRQRRAKGDLFPIEARGIRLEQQEQQYVLIIARDITLRKEAEMRIHELAFFDTLTRLPNRRLFTDRLNSAIELHRAKGNLGAVLYMDLDRFKTINDSLGHTVGDQLLCAIASRVRHTLPNEATCSRFGGDEFVMLVPEIDNTRESCAEAAANLASELVQQMQIPFEIDGHVLYCSASVGISLFPHSGADQMDVLRQADTALYRVKAMGRNGFQFYDPEMQTTAQQRLQVEKGLHQALDNDELELWYQPQYNSREQMIGAEVLIRWNHPERGMVLPGEFIQVAEDSGQILDIGNWVLDRAFRQLCCWREQGLPETFQRLAVNISPMQFMQVDFVDRVTELLKLYQLPGSMLELEITENMLLNNFDVACQKMKLLKQKGVHFAIDDFGTGYSSLKYLRHLPLDVLKIDRSFVTGLRTDTEQAAIVQVIITTAERLNLVVIAEGVETVDEREALQQLGCFSFQGYLFARPISADLLTEKLTLEQTKA